MKMSRFTRFFRTTPNEEEESHPGGIAELVKAIPTTAIINETFREPQYTPARTKTPGIGQNLDGKRMPSAGLRSGTGAARHQTARPQTASRPLTAVKSAGYVSKGWGEGNTFDPLNQGRSRTSFADKREETPEEKLSAMERAISALIDESALANGQRNYRIALERAREAVNREKAVERFREQANISTPPNIDIVFSVQLNLAIQCASNELYTEALQVYQSIVKNKLYGGGGRFRVNIGNIYVIIGDYGQALKNYRMALDQIPKAFKWLRGKIMHNIAILFVKLGQFSDAATTFEFVMQENPTFKAGLHLNLCYVLLMDHERLRTNFQRMLDLPLEEDGSGTAERDNHITLMDVGTTDLLRDFHRANRNECELAILMSAKLLASIESNFTSAYEWCIEAIRRSDYRHLADELEINKAISLLQAGNITSSVSILTSLSKKQSEVSTTALSNLCGILWLKADKQSAMEHAFAALDAGAAHPGLYVNLGNCYFSSGDYEKARDLYEKALDSDNLCVEAAYNLGSVLKNTRNYQDSLDYFQKVLTVLRGQFDVIFLVADIYETIGDYDMASEFFLQLLGVLPNEPRVLQRLGNIFDLQKDKQQALYYYTEAYRYSPSSIQVIEWLASYYTSVQLPEKGLPLFESAAISEPHEPRWMLSIASVHKKSGSLMKAYEVYKQALEKFPDSIEILQNLVRLTSDLGFPETKTYAEALSQMEQSRLKTAQRLSERTGSSSSRISSSGTSDELRFSSPSTRHVEISSARWESPRAVSARPKTAGLSEADDEYILNHLLPQ